MRAYDDLEALRRRRGARSVQVGAQKRDARGVGGKDARVAGAGLPDLEGEVSLGVGVPYPVREDLVVDEEPVGITLGRWLLLIDSCFLLYRSSSCLREVLQARGHLGDVVRPLPPPSIVRS